MIVHQFKDVQAAAYLTILSAYITAGQRCTCARRLIVVNDSQTEPYLQTLVAMIKTVRAGLWNQSPEPFLGAVVDASAAAQVLEIQENLIAQGASSVVELKQDSHCSSLLSPGLVDVSEVEKKSDQECFGPLLQLERVDDFEQALERANDTVYGLSAGLLSDSSQRYQEFFQNIRAGVVNWNRQTTGASGKLPFGGIGDSGNHRPSGYFAADYCSYPVASLESEDLSMPEKLMNGIDWPQ